uniref:Uncharacterized protein n=1 Tax=Anopheles atroparvus TaxID=41427 RepID=A0AAG5DV20_ANOAO
MGNHGHSSVDLHFDIALAWSSTARVAEPSCGATAQNRNVIPIHILDNYSVKTTVVTPKLQKPIFASLEFYTGELRD